MRGRVEAVLDLNPETFHQKFIVCDPKTTRAAVLTGSTNFTPTGVHKNLNHIVILRGKTAARAYRDEFDEAWSGTFGAKRERHDPVPAYLRLARVQIKVLFAPDHAPEMEIMKQMLKARERVDFAMFTFARSSGVDDAMIALSHAGIPVRGVLDRQQANQKWAATRPIAGAGADLWWPKTGTGINKVHHKLAVIDKQVIIAGSFNYTEPATALNDENIIVIGDSSDDNAETQTRQRQLARYALDEIERIISTHAERVPV
jgi:phosphatidylserine/phosphatidylglycerophosphate/cardiolipin synthase-like enzyme